MLRDKFYEFRLFFRNIRLWYPILKKDQQFDHSFIYIAIEHKLKLTEDFFRSEDTHVLDALVYADQIHDCRILLTRLIADDYMSPEAERYYSRMDLRADRQTNKHKADVLRWIKEEETARKNDRLKLFSLLHQNLDGWWD